jgi:hypothetical protein
MKKKLLQICVLGGLALISPSGQADEPAKPEAIAGALASGAGTSVAFGTSLYHFDKAKGLTESAASALAERDMDKHAQLFAEARAARKKFWISSIASLLSFASSFCGGLTLGDHIKAHSEETKVAPQMDKAKAFKQDPRDVFITSHAQAQSGAAN